MENQLGFFLSKKNSDEDKDSIIEDFRTKEADVTKVVHSGLIMRPVYELAAKRFEGKTAEHLDTMWLAFAVLDTISEFSAIKSGATRQEVLNKVLPAAYEMVKCFGIEPDQDELADVVNKIFDHLVNRSNRYFPFEYTCFNGLEKKYETRKFWLVKNVYTGFGREAVFTLTDEGYCVYFGLHETSALDGSAIGNLRIKMFVERGNLDDAITVADQNQKQCLRKAREIKNIRRSIKRNILSVDFDKVEEMANQGARQAIQIQEESSRLYRVVIDNLRETVSERLKSKFYYLGDQLKELNSRQMDLISELQNLPDDYHNNSHKLLRRRSPGLYPSGEDLIKIASNLEENYAVNVGKQFIACLNPPRKTVLFDPGLVIDAIESALEKSGAAEKNKNILQEIDGETIEKYKPQLTDEIIDRAFSHITHRVFSSDIAANFEDLLKDQENNDADPNLSLAMCMAVFQCIVDSGISRRNMINVNVNDSGKRIKVKLPCGKIYTGHDLILKSLEK